MTHKVVISPENKIMHVTTREIKSRKFAIMDATIEVGLYELPKNSSLVNALNYAYNTQL